MKDEKDTVEIIENQLEAVAGGECAQWKVIGYCSNCRERTWFKCSMYPGEGPFYHACGTELTDVRVEEY